MQWSNYRQNLVRQDDHFFVGRVPDELRPLGEVAAMHTSDGIDAYRWWTVAELDATEETIYPKGSPGWSGRRWPSSPRPLGRTTATRAVRA